MEAIAEDLFKSEKVSNMTCIIAAAKITGNTSLKPVLLFLYHREKKVVLLVPCMGCLLVDNMVSFFSELKNYTFFSLVC